MQMLQTAKTHRAVKRLKVYLFLLHKHPTHTAKQRIFTTIGTFSVAFTAPTALLTAAYTYASQTHSSPRRQVASLAACEISIHLSEGSFKTNTKICSYLVQYAQHLQARKTVRATRYTT